MRSSFMITSAGMHATRPAVIVMDPAAEPAVWAMLVSSGVNALRSPERAMLVITHYQRLLDHIAPDYTHVFIDGRVVRSGGPELAREVETRGYQWVRDALAAEA